MQILQTRDFKNVVKRLQSKQKQNLDAAVREVTSDPLVGEQKIGDLSGVIVYKFRMVGQLTLLAYAFDKNLTKITFLYLGSHANFYRDLKS